MLIRLLRSHLGPYKKILLGVVVLSAVQTTAALTLPTINAHIIDDGILKHNQPYIWRMGGIMLIFSLIQIVFAVGAIRLGAMSAMGFGRDLRNSLFHRVTGFSAREVNMIGAPSLITRITNDVQQIQMLVVMICTMAISAPITMVVGVIMALRQDLGLSTILLVSMPASAIVLGVIVAGMVPAFRVMQERIDQINRVLREQITGIRVVRAFVREKEETRRFTKANDELTEVSLRAGRLMSAMFPTVNVLVNLSSVGVLWLGASRVNSGAIQVGTIVAYLSYLLQILMSVVMATFMVSMIPRAAVSAGRAQEVLDTTSSVEATDAPEAPRVRGQVEFRSAGFHYPGAERAVLNDITFLVERGQTTAIIGSSGAGKTTLVNLIPRLFDVTSGAVLMGGVDVRDIDPDVLSSKLGLVPQKPYLFSGTIRSTLQYGKPDATEREMWAALRVAQAADFVKKMPGKLDALVEQGGANLSGGQRQRLSIARALIRKPEIFIFDDSFSALDLTTDARLRAALPKYTDNSAVLIVAQRVSTIAGADQIIVLENGEMIGIGTYEELLDRCPTFAEIVQSQIGEREGAMA
ncbi:MAG: ABC transporter ATP-binding protein [Actinobacteria bacterium]|nr:ABC transporter ATP-binding protein [Actinomycetota bacterium]MBV9935742.1 ABC transporter ATP-binding protein [Actinomycetota bacterium]